MLYMLEILLIKTWKKTYTLNFSLIDITDLQKVDTDSKCHLPLKQVPRGRPKKERYRKGKKRAPQGEAAAYALRELADDG